MKLHLLLIVSACLALIGCLPTATLYAQTLPATIGVSWDPRPVSENITSYEIALDASPAVVVSATPAASGKIETTISVPNYGHHTLTIISKSVSLACDDPTQCSTVTIQSSGPITPLPGFTLAAAPGNPTNPKVTKK